MSNKKIKQELPPDDIVDFLKEKKGGIVINLYRLWGPLRCRLLAFVAMAKGYFSLSEFFQLLSPLSLSSAKSKLMYRYNFVFLREELEKECPTFPDKCVNLFGHKFGWSNFHEVFIFIYEVIILDQYYANQFIKKDSIIIDAGAHIGTFSVFAAHLAPQGHVYSFEPVAKTFRVLKENAKHYPQITCINSGLGDGIYQKNIIVSEKYTSGSVLEDSPCGQKFFSGIENGMELVNILTIDAFIAEHNISHVDFIKIDTEGYETKVLKGAKETIKKWKPVVAMSAYHNLNDKEDLPKIMKEICPDYICELHKDREEDFICYIKK